MVQSGAFQAGAFQANAFQVIAAAGPFRLAATLGPVTSLATGALPAAKLDGAHGRSTLLVTEVWHAE